jgi:glycosyltransferase involved in cell wall biosynthesis
VILVPWRRGAAAHDVPAGVDVDETLAQALETMPPSAIPTSAVTSPILRGDLHNRPSLLLSPRAVKRLLLAAARAERSRIWLASTLSDRGIAASTCVAFTFWFDHLTLGFAMAKDAHPGLVVAARVNGADLYLERHRPAYLPGRTFALARTDCVFTASQHADAYLRAKYPGFQRSEIARLGVADPGFTTAPSESGRFVVVSCSAVVPVKRVPLIARGIRELALQRADRAFEWHHFGDGPARSEVATIIRELPPNATATLHGHVPNAAVVDFYRRQPVDLFINGSASEGGAPLAVVEAASVGLPIVATNVGGNPEIVSERNGALLPPNPGAAEIARVLGALMDNSPALAAMRRASREIWAASFRAETNATAFGRRLLELRHAAQ